MKIATKCMAGFFAAAFLTAGLACSQAAAAEKKEKAYTLRDLNEQLVMATLWVQTSAEYRALCPPLYRNVVVAVRAENGPNLPVMYLGQMYARTDASGAAHFMVRVRPYEQFDVTLATSEKGNEWLRPQNPAKAFVAKAQDEVMFFDQRFQVEKKPVGPRGPSGPVRIP